MTDLFSNVWMLKFKDEWNKEPALSGELGQIKFDSCIAYGFIDEVQPRGVIKVAKGKVSYAGNYNTEQLDWDLRAEPCDWQQWVKNPPGIIEIGMAYTAQKLRFIKGDYASMIKNPRMAGPFITSFGVMSRV